MQDYSINTFEFFSLQEENCIKALLGNGFIKVQSFRESQNKLASAYPLKSTGITEKAGLKTSFLAQKVIE